MNRASVYDSTFNSQRYGTMWNLYKIRKEIQLEDH